MPLPSCVPQECGKDFRHSLKKPSPNLPKGRKQPKVRWVPAFTIQSMQRNTKVIPPRTTGVYDVKPLVETEFRRSYQRGEFPIAIQYTNMGRILTWTFPVEKLDYHHYLPMFIEGLSEGAYPYNFIIEQGIKSLVTKAPYKVLPVVPQLIVPIKKALATNRVEVMVYTLRCIEMLVMYCDHVGEALVPYYRQILPNLCAFRMRKRVVDDINQIIVREQDLQFKIDDTLQVLERYGGPDAFINIKYIIPTYESCMLN